MQGLLFIACVMMLVSSPVLSRPVSYPGGATLMQMNDVDMHSIHIHYSPTAKFSIGYKGEYWREQNWQFHGVQINYLVKRWNKLASQANLYLKSGLGIAHSDFGSFDNETEAAAFTGIAADWETRRYFTSYENRVFSAGDIEDFISQTARAGIAPYIGAYGQLHTWLMLQAQHSSQNNDGVTITPLLRLFKGTFLTELGVNEDSELLFNLVVRF